MSGSAADLPQDEAAQLRRKGWERYNFSDLEGALAAFDDALKLDATDGQALAGKGVTLAAQQAYEPAIEALTAAIDQIPDFSLAWYYRAEARRALVQIEAALVDYDRSLELAPRDQTYVGRGLARVSIGEMEAALADFTHPIDLNPKHAQAFLCRAQVLAYVERLPAALADFDQAARLELNDLELYQGRAMVRLRRGDLAGAVADYRQALELDRGDWRLWMNLALALQTLEQTEAATQAVQEASALVSDEDRAEYEALRAVLDEID
mgnify:CR=1 FL=1